MRIIGCRIENEYIITADKVAGAVGSHDDVLLLLHFNSMWQGLTKSITWLDANGENPVITMLTVDMAQDDTGLKYLVPVPAEAKAVEGEMFMTIKGVTVEGSLEKTATLTAFSNFTVLPSRWDPDAEEAADITATLAAQLQAEIDTILADIQDAIASGTSAAQSAASAEAALNSFLNADALAVTLPSGEPATVTVTTVSGHKRFTFGIPAGASGGGDMFKNIYDPANGARQVMFYDAVIDGGTWV